MNCMDFLAPSLRSLAPYRPGITEEKLRRASGLSEVYKFSSNEAPYPPSAAILDAMLNALGQSHRYPDAQALLDQLSQKLRVPAEALVLGNGSIDVIGSLVRAFVASGSNVVLSEYGYCAYRAFVVEQGAELRIARSTPRFGHDVDGLLACVDAHTRMMVIDSPANLSGEALSATQLVRLVDALPPHVLLVLDEAYAEFAGPDAPRDTARWPLRVPNVIVTRTFSKAYGLAGLRIGYGIADPRLLEGLRRIRPPFPVSRVALAGAAAALADEAHLARIVSETLRGRRRLAGGLAELGVEVAEAEANFVLADFGADGARIHEALLARGFITRAMTAYGLPTHLRITVSTTGNIDRLLAAVRSLLEERAPHFALGERA